MELRDLLLEEKTIDFEVPNCPGFRVSLAYLSKERNQAIVKKCTNKIYNSKTRNTYDELDDDRFLEEYVGAIIKGWKGFKAKYLQNLVITKDLSEEQGEEEIEFSPASALELMKVSTTFDAWVSDMISDLGNFSTNNTRKK